MVARPQRMVVKELPTYSPMLRMVECAADGRTNHDAAAAASPGFTCHSRRPSMWRFDSTRDAVNLGFRVF